MRSLRRFVDRFIAWCRAARTVLGDRWRAARDLGHRRLRLVRPRPIVAVGVVWLGFVGLALSALVPGRQVFEGSLLVSEVRFTSDRRQPLLSAIDRLETLEIKGAIVLRWLGKIQTSSDRRLVGRDRLEIRLGPTGHVQISTAVAPNPPIDHGASGLSLDSLRLASGAQVDRLRYNHANRRRLSLQLASPAPEASRLAVNWGTQPLRVTIDAGFSSAALPTLPGQTGGDRLTFTFLPEGDRATINLPGRVELSMNLPSPEQVDPSEWLWPQLAVRDVAFERRQSTADEPEDDRPVSTLLGGTIRLAGQEAKLEADRFLTLTGPGIRHLDKLQLQFPEKDKPQTGLAVQLSGETDQIDAGLNRDFPALRLRASFLGRYFPNDVVIAILSFSTAIAGSLLVWLLDRFLGSS